MRVCHFGMDVLHIARHAVISTMRSAMVNLAPLKVSVLSWGIVIIGWFQEKNAKLIVLADLGKIKKPHLLGVALTRQVM